MLYFSEYIDEVPKSISEEEALRKVLGTYRDCDAVRDWLTIPNCIVCRLSTVYVLSGEDDGWSFDLLLLRGTMSPEGVEYDERTGNRI